MKKKWGVRYFVTAVASVRVYKGYGKTEAYRQATKDGWGALYRDENNSLQGLEFQRALRAAALAAGPCA